MELRRALLLFALVLGLAAVATSVSRRDGDGVDQRPPASETGPAEATGRPLSAVAARITFPAGARPATERLAAGQPASVAVEVRESGLVELEGLGLTAAAEPLTPARFEVLVADEGRYRLRFTAAGSDEQRTVGTLLVGPPKPTR